MGMVLVAGMPHATNAGKYLICARGGALCPVPELSCSSQLAGLASTLAKPAAAL